jgi:hypothetical protein
LVEVPASSANQLKELQECERERRCLEVLRKRHKELRVVQARQAERQVALGKLARRYSGENEVSGERLEKTCYVWAQFLMAL